jgi:glyoxylase-like metal-dependent hydrolase (beta-lactamase superfamily II)
MSADTTLSVPRDFTASVDLFISALGGREKVNAAAGLRVIAEGERHHPGWGFGPETPEKVSDFTYTLVEDSVASRYRIAIKSHTYLVPTDLDYVEIANGSAGHLTGIDFMFDPRPVDTPIPSWRVGTRQRHFDLTSPLRLARKLIATGADVSAELVHLSTGQVVTVLVLRETGRPPVRIYLDSASGLPVRAEVTEDHSPRGDALVEIRFDDYREVDGLVLPFGVDIDVDGTTVHRETRSEIAVLASIDADECALSHAPVRDGSAEQVAFSQFSTEWIMTYVFAGVRFYFDLQTAPITADPQEISEGVKIVLGPSHNMLVVEMPDSIATVEAPMYAQYSRVALAQVKAAFPGKLVQTVIATHFHYDHIGGIREFAAEGNLTVIAGEPTVSFFEAVLKSPHTIGQDRLEVMPVTAQVHGVTSSMILQTARAGRLEIYRITSDHSEDMVIVYLTGPKLVFESDLWNPTPTAPQRGAQRGRLASQLYDAITELGLDVRTIVGGHSGTDGKTTVFSAPIEYLKEAADR